MTETHAPYLHVVRQSTAAADPDPDPDPGPVPDDDPDADPDPAALAAAPLSHAIMHAVVGWLALCMERVAVAVEIQPIADRLYEVSAHFDEQQSAGVLLRVRLDVEPGLVVRTTVEPLRPS